MRKYLSLLVMTVSLTVMGPMAIAGEDEQSLAASDSQNRHAKQAKIRSYESKAADFRAGNYSKATLRMLAQSGDVGAMLLLYKNDFTTRELPSSEREGIVLQLATQLGVEYLLVEATSFLSGRGIDAEAATVYAVVAAELDPTVKEMSNIRAAEARMAASQRKQSLSTDRIARLSAGMLAKIQKLIETGTYP